MIPVSGLWGEVHIVLPPGGNRYDRRRSRRQRRPTVLLVHGAFADSSGWNHVIKQLQAAGVAV
jgi:alpha-beta hydrolase superfamily lysophospholipase